MIALETAHRAPKYPPSKLTKLEEGRRLQPIPIGPFGPIIPICMHGWEPIWEAVGGTCEGDCDFFPEPEEGNSRRNLRFGNTGGDGCCFPYFAPWGPGPGGL